MLKGLLYNRIVRTCADMAKHVIILQYVGKKDHLSGLSLPGNNLYPLKLVTKLFQLAQKDAAAIGIDVKLHTYTPVHAIDQSSGGNWIARTARGDVKCRAVVHATNAYASHLIPSLSESSQPVVPCRAQVMAIRPPSDKTIWEVGFCRRF